MKVAIIGGGLMGLASAWKLAERGHDVTVFEQATHGHARGSSTGNSRIVRQAYPDAFYTELLLSAYSCWHLLDEIAGGDLLHEVGLITVADIGEPSILSLIAGLRSLEVEHDVLMGPEANYLIEGLRVAPSEVAVVTRQAGWVNVPLVLQTLFRLAESAGARIVQQRVSSLAELAVFDRVVITAGAWVNHFVPIPVTTTRQSIVYLDGHHSGPVWIESFDRQFYGFPSEPGRADFKIGIHSPGSPIDPDTPDRNANPEDIEAIQHMASRRFGVEQATVTESYACVYTSTANEDFIIDWADDRHLVVSACSGHGFKFGPWVGGVVADMLEGLSHPDQWPRFQWRR